MKSSKMFMLLATAVMISSICVAGEVEKDARIQKLAMGLQEIEGHCADMSREELLQARHKLMGDDYIDLTVSQLLVVLNLRNSDGKKIGDIASELFVTTGCEECKFDAIHSQRERKSLNILIDELAAGDLSLEEVRNNRELQLALMNRRSEIMEIR